MKQSEFVAEIQLKYLPTSISRKCVGKIKSSIDAYNFLKTIYNPDTVALTETFVLLFTNYTNDIIGYNFHSSGNIASTQVEIRLIVAIAINCACSGVIISHNHPSGAMRPSNSDKEITNKINQALELFNIRLLDHIIVSPIRGDYYSFADNGDL